MFGKRLFENNLITSTTTKKLTSLYIFLLNGNLIIEDIYLHRDLHAYIGPHMMSADFMPICQEPKKETERYGFDVINADRIFDLLLQEIKLSPNCTIPSAAELKNHKYCKWHISVSHNTCECRVFCREIQCNTQGV